MHFHSLNAFCIWQTFISLSNTISKVMCNMFIERPEWTRRMVAKLILSFQGYSAILVLFKYILEYSSSKWFDFTYFLISYAIISYKYWYNTKNLGPFIISVDLWTFNKRFSNFIPFIKGIIICQQFTFENIDDLAYHSVTRWRK